MSRITAMFRSLYCARSSRSSARVRLEAALRAAELAAADWRAQYLAARDEVRRLTDAALSAAGADPVFHPRPQPPPAGELRPIRRLRDWRREMEFLEAQAFARSKRGEPVSGRVNTPPES